MKSWRFCKLQVIQWVAVSQSNILFGNSTCKHSMLSSRVNALPFLYLKNKEETASDVLTVPQKGFPLARHMAAGALFTPRSSASTIWDSSNYFPLTCAGQR